MRPRRALPLIFGMMCGFAALAPAQQLPERPTSTLVWDGPKADLGGSVSQDGRFLSFTDWTTGDLALRDLSTNTDRTIVAARNEEGGRVKFGAETSTISDDGSHIAYSWWDENKDGYELRVASLGKEAAPRRLHSAEWLAPRDWSPDGQWIAALVSMKDFTQQLVLVPVNGGEPRILKAGHWPGDTRVFFSPDGKYIAYDLPQVSASARDVWVTAVDRTSDSRVVSHRANDITMGWSPDGKYLLFASDRAGPTALFALEIQSGVPRGTPVPLKSDMGYSESIGVTSAGALYWATRPGSRGGSIQIAGFDLESGTVTSPRDVSTSPNENNVNPHWSPDGRHLAYVSGRGRSDEPPTIVLRTADAGGLEREIVPKLGGAELAGWEPDSKSILLVGQDVSGRRGAFRLSIETEEMSFLFATPPSPTLSLPTWSEDGRTLYYWNRVDEGAAHVFIARNLTSGSEQELVRRPFLGVLLRSPDGRFIATETADRHTNERGLLLVPVNGNAPRDLMRIPSGVSGNDLTRVDRGARLAPASFTPDGLSVIVKRQHEPEGPSELWQVPIDGGTPRQLATTLEAGVFAFKISPDGRRVAYRVKESEPALPRQIWKFEHFIPR